ncbi:MAG: GNAT family N-acetyltransferase [Candidatus Contendobacter sp.]|jgi:acetyltransferase|nr:GNAT family N-acetyltransferase [Gammaproteobacteria bacterium]MCC8994744.1 GNAT family N-acetyltransferase [Candidatus Contendobacter sp.]
MMPTRPLKALFNPASVALIGASERPGSMGAALTSNLLAGSFKGELFLLNRRHRRIQDRHAFAHLADLPHVPELAIIATPRSTIPELVTELGRLGTRVAVIATDHGPLGSDAMRQFHHTLRERARPHDLRLLGPDSLGVIVPRCGLNASLSHLLPWPGHLALIAQSGAVLAPMLEWATAQGIGFSSVIALGERADLNFSDLLDWQARDPETRAILLYLETLTDARKFLSAARAAARIKPVLVVRAGRGGDPASHQVDAIYDAAFRRAGMLRVSSLRELFWAAETLALDIPATGDRLAIVGNSRGLGLLAADALFAEGGRLARFSPALQEALHQVLPSGFVLDNPLDLGGDADPARVAAVLEPLLKEREIDCLLVLHSPNALVCAEAVAMTVCATVRRFRAQGGKRPGVLTCWLGANSACAARQRFLEQLIPSYDLPNDAVRAFMQRWQYQQNRIALMETPPDPPEGFTADSVAARQMIRTALAEGRDVLTPAGTVVLLQAYGVGFTTPEVATASPSPAPALLELAIRMIVDPAFGPVLLLGPGGRSAPLFNEVAAALPPLNPVLAREVIAHTRIGQLLCNADAAMAGLLDSVMLLLVKVAQLVVDLGEIVELELNPVLATAQQATVGAARVQIATSGQPAHARLAIRPYPRELEETLALPDGSTLLIRPVRPEDEPAFIAGFARLTTEEIRMRFMHLVKELTHVEAARLTQIDYDREMALVAVRQRPGQEPEGCGVARIIGDADGERAEFAIILLREATGIGLSSLLLRRLIHYARDQGLREIFGEILRENEPMLELCRAMGFTVKVCPDDSGVVIATLALR